MLQIKRKYKTEPGMSFSTISDIAFLLIIFFMVTMAFVSAKGLHMALPGSHSSIPASGKLQAVITIHQNTSIYFNKEKVSLKTLTNYITRLHTKKGPIELRIHEQTPYYCVTNVLDILQQQKKSPVRSVLFR